MFDTFLRAAWEKLIFVNYEIDAKHLQKYVPFGTELDFWHGKTYVSIVAFDFRDTAILGIKFPFHTNFVEVNLRFYVKYFDGKVWKRGAVFIKEIVPRAMITLIANTLYNENYATHKTAKSLITLEDGFKLRYEWLNKDKWNFVEVGSEAESRSITSNGEEEFITEHYWGYAKVSEKSTTEYEVVHPKWKIHTVRDFTIEADFEDLYGSEFAFLANAIPSSVFLTDGSRVSVKKGRTIHG